MFVLVFVLSGCAGLESQEVSVSSGMIEPDIEAFDAAIAESDSEFVKAILRDYVITKDELSEAFLRASECMTEHGIDQKVDTDVVGDPFILIEGAEMDSHVADFNACEDKWLGAIELLARGEEFSADDEKDQVLIAACLVRMGIVPPGFTAQDLDEVYHMSDVPGSYWVGEGEALPPDAFGTPTAESLLPGGIPLYSNEVTEPCLLDPRRAGLVPE